jgi:hypothetical protein
MAVPESFKVIKITFLKKIPFICFHTLKIVGRRKSNSFYLKYSFCLLLKSAARSSSKTRHTPASAEFSALLLKAKHVVLM